MDFETRYREGVNAKGLTTGRFNAPTEMRTLFEKDALYKLSCVKTAEPLKAKQGRPKKSTTATPSPEEGTKTPEQPATT